MSTNYKKTKRKYQQLQNQRSQKQYQKQRVEQCLRPHTQLSESYSGPYHDNYETDFVKRILPEFKSLVGLTFLQVPPSIQSQQKTSTTTSATPTLLSSEIHKINRDDWAWNENYFQHDDRVWNYDALDHTRKQNNEKSLYSSDEDEPEDEARQLTIQGQEQGHGQGHIQTDGQGHGQELTQSQLFHSKPSSSSSLDRQTALFHEDQPIDIEKHAENIKSLGPSQRRVFQAATSKQFSHTFVTGGGGRGKTFVLKTIINELRLFGRKVAVLAPTGKAAKEIDGTTIDSFLLIPPESIDDPNKSLISLASHVGNRAHLIPLILVDTIVIDETSMVSARKLDLFDLRMRFANVNKMPFGGKQILLYGDFFQLQPVIKDSIVLTIPEKHKLLQLKYQAYNSAKKPSISDDDETDEKTDEKTDQQTNLKTDTIPKPKPFKKQMGLSDSEPSAFCFDSDIFPRLFLPGGKNVFELKENYRQKDPVFGAFLDDVRYGKNTDTVNTTILEWMNDQQQRNDGENHLSATDRTFVVCLYATRKRMIEHNILMQEAVSAKTNAETYVFPVNGVFQPWTLEERQKQKALIENLVQNRKKMSPSQYFKRYKRIVVPYQNTQEQAKEILEKHPLNHPDLRFSVGSRVMLSRNVDLKSGLVHGRAGWIVNFTIETSDDTSLIQSTNASNASNKTISKKSNAKDAHKSKFDLAFRGPVPHVMFDGHTHSTKIFPMKWHGKSKPGLWTASQLPLEYAWAITIHQSQSLSLDAACIDLSQIFSPGQAYVALSRLKTRQGLVILDYKPGCIQAHRAVQRFYERMFPDSHSETKPWSLQIDDLNDLLSCDNDQDNKEQTLDVIPLCAIGESKGNQSHQSNQFISSAHTVHTPIISSVQKRLLNPQSHSPPSIEDFWKLQQETFDLCVNTLNVSSNKRT